jgi:hypothetical protein
MHNAAIPNEKWRGVSHWVASQAADIRKLAPRGFSAGSHAREGSRVLGDGFGNGAVVDELAFAAALDQAGVGKNFEVMGNGGGSDTAEGDEFSADHLFLGGNGLKNHEAGGIRQSL